MSETDLAWAAGLFDGEGCISYHKAKKSWQVAINMTDYPTLERFVFLFGGNIIPIRNSGNNNHKPAWRWARMGNKVAPRILRQLLPYLVTKRARADLATGSLIAT